LKISDGSNFIGDFFYSNVQAKKTRPPSPKLQRSHSFCIIGWFLEERPHKIKGA
jgi:hypothetical protein